ncbi:MAG: phosphatidate cytidylyltransferase [Proteobacteria bacterium]|nr:phosphatidate cytidylyltransferase [Pseudomonadota bacterium]
MLRTRVLTAIVLLALLLAVLFWLPAAAAVGCLGMIVLLGAWEWAGFAGLTAAAGRLGYLAAVALGCAIAFVTSTSAAALAAWMAGAALWWLVALAWLALRPHAVNRLAAALAGFAVLVPAWLGLARLYLAGTPPRGSWLLLFMLLLVWAADIGAYFAGRRFGRVKLAPAVSPNKSWEGVLGGALLTLAVGLAGASAFAAPRVPFLGLVGAVFVSSIVGDLTESMFKRFAQLKDSGSLLPGHGGVLDRIDSITSAVPFYVLGLGWLGLLPGSAG